MDIESIMKWGLILGVTGFSVWMLYSFAVKQGWLSAQYRPRLTQMKASVIR